MPYNTGNPLGSTDPRDLYDNAQIFDQLTNGASPSYVDRLGSPRLSLSGVQTTAEGVLNALGYSVPAAYTSGISLTTVSQTVDYNGVIYAPKFSSLPFTTTGTFETAKFRSIQVTDADLITYVPSGTDAIPRSVQKKLREFVSVLDFGADPTGLTNTTAAIQKAIDATPTNGVLCIPPGTYLVSYGVLNFTRKSSIRVYSGSSKYSAILKAETVSASASTPLLDIAGCASLTFEGIKFQGVTKSGLGVYIHRPISGADAFSSDHKFVDCYFTQFDRGVQIGRLTVNESNNEDMKFYDCKIDQCNIGYAQYNPNSLQNVMHSCSIWECPIGIQLGGNSVQTGSLVLYNINLAVHTISAIYFAMPASLQIYGGRCETMKTFISQAGWSSSAFPSWSIYDMMLVNQTDSTVPVIQCSSSGFTAVNCQFGTYVEPKQWISSDNYQVKNVLINCKFNFKIDYGVSPTGGPYYTFGNYGMFDVIGCQCWDYTNGRYDSIADMKYRNVGTFTIKTATPDVTKHNLWVAGPDADLTITSFTALQYQEFTIVRAIGPSPITTIQFGSAIRLKSGSNTVVTTGMKFVHKDGITIEV